MGVGTAVGSGAGVVAVAAAAVVAVGSAMGADCVALTSAGGLSPVPIPRTSERRVRSGF